MKSIDRLKTRNSDGVLTSTGASDNQILEIEQIFDVKFNDEYLSFLRTYGAASLGGFEIFGIWATIQLVEMQDVVQYSRRLLKNTKQLGIVIGHDGGDLCYVFLCDNKICRKKIGVVDIHTGELHDNWPSGLTMEEYVADICAKL